MKDLLAHRQFPCFECPWRRDVAPGKFPAARYEALAHTSGQPGAEAPFGAPIFGCHNGQPGHEDREAACAGWLAAVGLDHIGIRVAVAFGQLPAEALEPGEGWPELFTTYTEMAAAQGREDSDVR